MKARIKETGEIVECALGHDGFFTYINHGEVFGTVPENVEIINDDIDWEQRKFDLVKDLTCEFLKARTSTMSMEDVARLAIKQADAVIAEYRKGGDQ